MDLSSLKLTGSISPHVGNLSFLRVLNLQNNSLSHIIPSEIGHLRRLQALSLTNNSIGGKIPSTVSSCSNLDYIAVRGNHLVREIPVELGSLSKLRLIDLFGNDLTGSIPSSLGNLSFLEVLFLHDNNLSGSIPDALGKLATLKQFGVGSNNLSGVVPPSLFNLSSIVLFYVGDNQLQGNLPFNMGITLPNLQEFVIGRNQFSGAIPISISNASKLELFHILFNNFTGEVPSLARLRQLRVVSITFNQLGNGGTNDLCFLCSLQNASNLQVLAINGNYFGGILPECIYNLSTNLTYFAAHSNKIFGGIPLGIGNLVNLTRLEMWNNRLSGSIPSSIGKLQKLVILQLQCNHFSGNIPSSIGNLTMLSKLTLQFNSLQGRIPSSLGRCQNLISVDLSNNRLSYTIPPQVFDLSSLSISLDLSRNRFTGAIPNNVGNLKNLGMLFLHQNMLDGEIPSSMSSCMSLEILNFQGNSFQGTIPASLSSLRGLQYIDLSHNNFSGQIPELLAILKLLLYLNLSFNNLEGPVPTDGVFKNASATSVTGNNKLCGGVLELNLPACRKSPNKMLLKAIAACLSGFFGVFLLVSILLFFRIKKSNQRWRASFLGTSISTISYKNIHDATNGFSSANLIGVGGFGSVFKGILRESPQLVAIKVFHLKHYGATRSFIAECQALRNIRHRNIVKVLTACSSIDYQGNDFKALVYEFMVNGSLQEWLHPSNYRADGNQEMTKNLSLSQRLNIAIDIVSALEYLHHHCETPIVHCDLKPSNVLLDDVLTAHISDFGQAKFLLERIHICSNQSSSVGLRGTIGYAPPEYGLGQELSTWGDVYSYGILLLEIFTGKRPTGEKFKDGWSLHEYAKSALPDGILNILDPFLLQEIDESKPSKIKECLISNIIAIGVACSVQVPGERMKITDVFMNLSSVRNKLLRIGLC